MIKSFLSTKISNTQANLGLLILRVVAGGLMVPHGYQKLINFSEKQDKFMDFMGIGSSTSLALTIGAEFFCATLVVAGLFTRLSLIPLVIAMGVATFKAHNGDIFGDGETAFLYFAAYTTLLITGAGRFSIDGLFLKK